MKEIAKTKTEKTTDKPKWGPAAAIIVVALSYIFSQIIAALIVGIYPILRHWNSKQANNWLTNSIFALFWLTLIIEGLVVTSVVLFLRHRKSNVASIGLKGRLGLSDIGYILSGYFVYFIISSIAIFGAHHAIPSINISEKQNIGFSTSTTGSYLILVFVSLVILPPIAEEILFRGFLYTGLKTKLPKVAAAILVSLIFASLHLLEGSNGLLWVAGLDIFILSLALVYVREKTGKLWASMGIHMIKNFVAFLALFVYHVN
jgi:membrane protease YdiL (CAAX protease family)